MDSTPPISAAPVLDILPKEPVGAEKAVVERTVASILPKEPEVTSRFEPVNCWFKIILPLIVPP
jgi:hypothetical protein